MTIKILIECGAAETRAAFTRDDRALRFWFGPARGDEALSSIPQTGDIFLGRVRKASKQLRGAFVDIGLSGDGFLPLKSAAVPAEGERIVVRIVRPAIGEKAPRLSASWTQGLGEAVRSALERDAAQMRAPGALRGEPVEPAVRAYSGVVPEGFESRAAIVVNDVTSANILRAGGAQDVSIVDFPFIECDADEALDGALERVVTLPGGGRMIFDETEALTAIDIDAGRMADGAVGILNDKVNHAAAVRLPWELSRRNIGGRIVIDFLPPSNTTARHALLDAIRASSSGVYFMRYGKLSPDGLLDLTAPRRGLSLLEHASEEFGDGAVRKGRRFTIDWRAKSAIRALESLLRASAVSRPQLAVGAEIGAYLFDKRPQWSQRLTERYAARFDIVMEPQLGVRDFDLVER